MDGDPKETILIIDDVATNLDILKLALRCDYEILSATNGKEALEIAFRQIPDLILLDVRMPEMDGYEVAHRLKANETTQDVPIIFVSALNREEDESKGFGAGVVDYITKPIRPSIVKARVRNHLDLKRYRDSLKILSTLDGLTGIPNRRYFDDIFQREWYRGVRHQKQISILLLDIDYFKTYNDNYGHLAGDECLRKLVGGLREIGLRTTDLLARFGGDEFILLLPETDANGADCVANKVQEKVKILNIPHAYSEIANHVTLSIGEATTIPSQERSRFDLINYADERLYEAKDNGRNQTMGKRMIKETQ